MIAAGRIRLEVWSSRFFLEDWGPVIRWKSKVAAPPPQRGRKAETRPPKHHRGEPGPMQNFNSLHAEVHQLKSCNNAAIRPFVNRAEKLQNSILEGFKAKFDKTSLENIKANLINPDDYQHFKSFGLDAGDLTRLNDLVNVNVRSDYKRLEELQGDTSRAEVGVLKQTISSLEKEVEDHQYQYKMLMAACKLGPEAVTTLQQILAAM